MVKKPITKKEFKNICKRLQSYTEKMTGWEIKYHKFATDLRSYVRLQKQLVAKRKWIIE